MSIFSLFCDLHTLSDKIEHTDNLAKKSNGNDHSQDHNSSSDKLSDRDTVREATTEGKRLAKEKSI